jgi:SSS family solute:Na+ symporter
VIHFRSDIAETQWGAIIGFLAGAAAMIVATIWDTPKPLSALHGLVWGYAVDDEGEARGKAGRPPWYKSPLLWGVGALILCVLFYIYIEIA